MSRSSLSTKTTIHNVGEFEKSFKRQYKEEHNEEFKGNVIYAITLGIIQKKRLPEITDIITLIKLENIKITDEQAELMLEKYLEDEGHTLTTAFCDLCNDLTIDIPLNDQFVVQIKNLAETINKQQTALNNISDILSKLTKLTDAKKEDTAEQASEVVENTVAVAG